MACSARVVAEILGPIFGGAMRAVNLGTVRRLTIGQFLAFIPGGQVKKRRCRHYSNSEPVFIVSH
jgi:hypothetical protein